LTRRAGPLSARRAFSGASGKSWPRDDGALSESTPNCRSALAGALVIGHRALVADDVRIVGVRLY
jgi:hypothetical protein